MRLTALCALFLLSACHSGINQELEALRAEVESQQAEIDRLKGFVDSQADVLRVCQGAMAELTDYLINTNAIGMFREAGAQMERLEKCSEAMKRFNAIATSPIAER